MDGLTLTVDGRQNPATQYQTGELERADVAQPGVPADGLVAPQGSWLRSAVLYKYSALVEGLRAGADYSYSVTVDGYRHEAHFTTNPASGQGVTEPVHFVAFSDTETDPVGRVTYREWVKNPLAEGSEPRPSSEDSAWARTFGTNHRDGELQLRYALTEDIGQRENNRHIEEADPDLLLVAGDIAERASWQTHWDEWFRHFAGDQGALLDRIPAIPSPGNHEVYGYCASPDDCTPVIRARALYNWHFDTNADPGSPARDAYHRTDHGPVTVIALDSTNGTDQVPGAVPEEMKISGNDANLRPEQYAWLEEQLADARAQGQIIVVQYHHVPYSNGTHGTTMGHEHVDAQPGTPMRHLQPLLEKYDVATVFSGHDETFQASYVDEAGDGAGVYHWDLGVASDGLRGEKMIPDPQNPDGEYVPLAFNTHSIWMAQRDEPELWRTDENGVRQLVSGGKHYGHLDAHGRPLPTRTIPDQPEEPGEPGLPAYPARAVLSADNTAAAARQFGLDVPDGAEVFSGDGDGDGTDTLALLTR